MAHTLKEFHSFLPSHPKMNSGKRDRASAKGISGSGYPEGISSISPGLRGTSYPGSCTTMAHTLKGFHHSGPFRAHRLQKIPGTPFTSWVEQADTATEPELITSI
jgi:hypothetical protein